ncbi:MAG: hypothetical protein F6K21_02615 [Symploca sp. SIO2D2]|nr:hypothetical protein [Symploca sp. SIO2D2]
MKTQTTKANPSVPFSASNTPQSGTHKGFERVSKANPCPHCGKDSWCYRIGELSVCKRKHPPAAGWYQTSKLDNEKTPYYAPVTEKKAIRPKQTRYWEYPSRDGSKLVRVVRTDDGSGGKKIKQQHWNGKEWKFGLKGSVERQDIPIYRYAEVRTAIANGQTIFLAEGEPCCDVLWELGIPATTNIGGSGKWHDSDTEDLEGASVVLVPDRDGPGLKHMKTIASMFGNAKWMLPFPDSQLWKKLPKSQGADVADWITDYNLSASDIHDNVHDENWLIETIEQLEKNLASEVPVHKSSYGQRYQVIKDYWGHRLRFNTLKQQVELDGEPLDLDFVRLQLCVQLDITMSVKEATEITLFLAMENSYCPIQEYLERVSTLQIDQPINLDSLALELLGSPNPLHAAYLKRHLIGSVARALNPGCKMDTALILQGKQGIKKSTFFCSLYGDEFFDDTMTESSERDELMKLHQHWAVELAEFETTLHRKGISKLKQFMSTRVDSFRIPYARTVKSFERHSVIVGSTNEPEFLNDPSGDRRYWVIPVKGMIDIQKVESMRNAIWAAAVAAYRAGEPWWLTEQEIEWAIQANEPFRLSDTWEDFISEYLEGRRFVTIAEVLEKALDMEASKQDKKSQMRAAAILRRFGWQKAKRWRGGTWKRGWELPERSTEPPSDEVDLGVGQSHKANEIKDSSYTDPPDPPIDPTFTKNQSLPETPADNTVKNPNENIGESLETSGSVSEVVREKNVVTAEVVATEQPTPTAPKEVTETTAAVELLNNENFSALNANSQQLALQIVQDMVAIKNNQDWKQVEQRYAGKDLNWVCENLLTKKQKRHFGENSIKQ